MLTITHLYPELLNLYGDRGNVMTLAYRCQWRDLSVRVEEVNLGDRTDFSGSDILFIGGGSDREQGMLSDDLARIRDHLARAVEERLVVLAVCGGYQMLGMSYRDAGGREIPGLGILDFHTTDGKGRLTGNTAVEIMIRGKKEIITGFENHGGRTHLGTVDSLGRVLSGHGNNGRDGREGARYKNLFCTYLHGPVLPRNPWFADYLISLALSRKGKSADLKSLDDSLEIAARSRLLKRLRVTTPTQ